MDVVRADLDALVALQAGGLTWNAIAAGLTAQGLTTADGRPITGRNLTGVISSIRRQAQRGATRDAERKSRVDVRGDAVATSSSVSTIPAAKAPVSASLRPALSPDLVANAAAGAQPRPTDAERRIAALARARSLLKKD